MSSLRSTAAGDVHVALESTGAQPRRTLPDGRRGAAEPLGGTAEAAAAVLVVERTTKVLVFKAGAMEGLRLE